MNKKYVEIIKRLINYYNVLRVQSSICMYNKYGHVNETVIHQLNLSVKSAHPLS